MKADFSLAYYPAGGAGATLPRGKKLEDDSSRRWHGEFQESEPVRSQPKCECGSAAVGVDKHSSWCPLNKKEEDPRG